MPPTSETRLTQDELWLVVITAITWQIASIWRTNASFVPMGELGRWNPLHFPSIFFLFQRTRDQRKMASTPTKALSSFFMFSFVLLFQVTESKRTEGTIVDENGVWPVLTFSWLKSNISNLDNTRCSRYGPGFRTYRFISTMDWWMKRTKPPPPPNTNNFILKKNENLDRQLLFIQIGSDIVYQS